MQIVRYKLLPAAGGLYYTVPSNIAGRTAPSLIISSGKAGNMGPSYDRCNENRQKLYARLGIAPEEVIGLRQEHTTSVLEAKHQADGGEYRERGDGLISCDRGLALSVTVADCLPVFLYHSSGVPFAVVHSGWKGTGIAAAAVEMMVSSYRVAPADLHAVIGPGIGGCCYRVDEERAALFRKRFGRNTVLSGPRLDLRQANINVLYDAGVRNIAVSSECTACTPWLGSYRREGPEKFTRMIALISFLL